MGIIGHSATERGGSVGGYNNRAAMREDMHDFPVSTPPRLRELINPKRLRPFGSTRVINGGNGMPPVTVFETQGQVDYTAMGFVESNLKAMGIIDAQGHFTVFPTKIEVHPQGIPTGPAK